jgi:hypothetical protein
VNLRGWLPAAYVQDNCKLSQKLTVNLGMRYEVVLPYHDTENRYANFLLNSSPPQLIRVLTLLTPYTWSKTMTALGRLCLSHLRSLRRAVRSVILVSPG